MKTSKAFKIARNKLWDGYGTICPPGKERYICYALTAGGRYRSPAVREDFLRAERIIMTLLGGYVALELWLAGVHGIGWYGQTPKLQATRKAWLDHLIEHYESMGD